jgi:hypothetical protein
LPGWVVFFPARTPIYRMDEQKLLGRLAEMIAFPGEDHPAPEPAALRIEGCGIVGFFPMPVPQKVGTLLSSKPLRHFLVVTQSFAKPLWARARS